MKVDVLRTQLSIPEWMQGPVARAAIAGGLAVGALAGCSVEQAEYSSGVSMVVEEDAPVFGDKDQSFIPLACGRTAARAQAVPVGQMQVEERNVVGDGRVHRYEFTVGEGGLPLKEGHSCGDRVWLFATLASPAGPMPTTPSS